MAGKKSKRTKAARNDTTSAPELLRGWKQISDFLAQPVAVAQRWARSGMLTSKEGRNVVASPDELSRWFGRESGTKEPVHIATNESDLSGELKSSLTDLKRQKRSPSRR